MIPTKEFKTKDNRIIICNITESEIIMKCSIFTARYKHNEINDLIELHSNIVTDRTLKELRKFIDESKEPEQLSLF